MAKGDILEPILELAGRVFFRRADSNSLLDELSWSWFAAMILAGLAFASIKTIVSAMEVELDEELAKKFKNKLRVGLWALRAAILLSLFMFRFATSL